MYLDEYRRAFDKTPPPEPEPEPAPPTRCPCCQTSDGRPR